MTTARPSPLHLQRGLSLVELMIGMVIGLFVIVGMTQVFVSSQNVSKGQNSASGLQEDGRYAIEILGREIRKTGFRANDTASIENAFPATAIFAAGAVIFGTNGTSGTTLTLRFQGSGAGGGDGFTRDCANNTLSATQTTTDTLSIVNSTLQCTAVRPGLASTQNIIGGVETMEITYGADTNADGFIDQYFAADAVANWTTIVSVRVQLLLRSNDNVTTTAQKYTFNGVAVTPTNTDRRLRGVYSTVVGIRSRAK